METLKAKLEEPHVLDFPLLRGTYIVEKEARNKQICRILLQKQPDRTYRPIGFCLVC